MKYQEKLWGKVDFLHERYKKKHLYISNFIDIITRFQNACLNFSKSLLLIRNKNYQLVEEKNSSVYNGIEKLLSFILLQSQEYNELFNNIKTNILEPTTKLLNELYIKEKDLYASYTKSHSQYHNFKSILEKSQKDYETSLKLCEKIIHNAKQIEVNPLTSKEDKNKNLNRANSFINNSKILEDKYFSNIEEANKMRINGNNKENDLLIFYQDMDYYNYNQIKGMIGIFLVFIKKTYESIFTSIENLSDTYKDINITKDLNNFVQNNKSEKKPNEPIAFIPYSPEASLDASSVSGDPKENEILHINYEVISTLRKSFRNIRDDLDMEEETKKHRLRMLSSKIFKIGPNVTFSKEEKEELLSYLNVPKFRNYFIITLSKQRTKGRFLRGEKLLEDLADILNMILEISEREKNYEEAKNCIILSQTFYSEVILDKKKKEKYKRYLFEYIMDNQWLTSPAFWEGIIEFMIQNELKKNEVINKDLIAKETLEEKRLRISNIGFSQLLSYTNNMLEFFIKKDIIIDMVDKFVKKYDIEKNFADMIYDNIKNTPEKPKPLPFPKRKKTKTINANNQKRSRSFIKKKDFYNLKIDFEVIEKNKKKFESVEKYETNIKFEDLKFKLNRKNNLSKKFKPYNFDDDSESLSSTMTMNNKNNNKSQIGKSFALNRNQSCQINESNISKKMEINNYNNENKMSFDITNKKDNINQNLNIENLYNKNNSINNNENKENIIKDNTNNKDSKENNNGNNKIEINNNSINIVNENNINNNKIKDKIEIENNININEENKINENSINNNEVKDNVNIDNNINISEENKINKNNINNEVKDKANIDNNNNNINEENKNNDNNDINNEDKDNIKIDNNIKVDEENKINENKEILLNIDNI